MHARHRASPPRLLRRQYVSHALGFHAQHSPTHRGRTIFALPVRPDKAARESARARICAEANLLTGQHPPSKIAKLRCWEGSRERARADRIYGVDTGIFVRIAARPFRSCRSQND